MRHAHSIPIGAASVRRWTPPLGAVALLGLAIALIASIGDHAPLAGIASVVETVLGPGMIALAWMLSAVGLGVWIVRGSWTLGACVGIGLALTLAHLMGVLGAFSGRPAQLFALAPIAIGVALLVRRWWTDPPSESVARGAGVAPLALLAAPALAVLIVACCLPAGTIWASEARGYDVLSYHLQLVNEWRMGGRIEPLTHNVYSFLPSYMEAAYTQLDAIISRPGGVGLGMAPSASAAQFLHALMGVLAGVVTGRLALELMTKAGVGGRGFGAVIATLVFLCTPWTIVTGSLAYNEMAMMVAFAGALLGASLDGLKPLARGALIGGLCAVAVSCKLTAAYLCVPSVVIAIVMLRNRKEWPPILGTAAVIGAAVLTPWLIRNTMHAGSPTFPFATGLFGTAHWTGEQAARWRSAHAPDTNLVGRIGVLFSDRGILHAQWSVFGAVAVGGLGLALRDPRTRHAGLLLASMTLAILIGWLLVGHQQSRFLMPLLVPGSACAGLGITALSRTRWSVPARAIAATLALAMGVHACAIFASENGGRPNYALVDGPALINASSVIASWNDYPQTDQQAIWESMGPIAATNLLVRSLPGARIALVGDATPLYFSAPVLYHTTWDASPIGEAIRNGQSPIARYQSEGVTHLLINFSELQRLSGLGWYDPEVSPAFVREQILPMCSVVRGWPEVGAVLVELPRAAANPAE